jgi:hypothetical protein
MEPNKCIQKINYENVHLCVFYDFSRSMGSRKSRCDVPSGTTQGQDCHGGCAQK